MIGLEGKTVLVTGSSSGIGLAIAKSFVEYSCNVSICGRSLSKLKAAQSQIHSSRFFQCDLTKPSDCQRLISQHDHLDILVCNIGSGKSVKPLQESHAEWQRVFETNLWSATSCIQQATPLLKQSSGVIICISSICGIDCVVNAPLTYSAAKAALNSYVKGLSTVLAVDGVRVNAVAPGNILFPGSTWDQKLCEHTDETNSYIQKNVPLGRFGTVEDVSNTVIFLASNLSSFITGQIIRVDGGQLDSY